MAKRTSKFEQAEHDLVIERSAATYCKRGGTAYTNPAIEKKRDIDGLYPDIIATEQGGLRVIEEIETDSTVTEDECERQWKPYSKLGYAFRLIVPLSKVELAKRTIRHTSLDVTLQGYTLSGKDVNFYDSEGKRIV